MLIFNEYCAERVFNYCKVLFIIQFYYFYFRSTDPRYYVAYLGKHRLSDSSDGIKVDFNLVIQHQDYNVVNKQNDVGLAKVSFRRNAAQVFLTVLIFNLTGAWFSG